MYKINGQKWFISLIFFFLEEVSRQFSPDLETVAFSYWNFPSSVA
jgi:hypothetical protein